MDSEFPSNSHKQKAGRRHDGGEKKKVERVVQGEVVRRKKPVGRRVAEYFIGTDARGAWGHAALEILLPAIKDGFVDSFHETIDTVFGSGRSHSRRRGRGRPGDGSYVSYNRYSQRDRHDEPRNISRRARASHDFDEIILQTRVEAEEVIDQLFELVSKFDAASVLDLYDMVGVTSSFTDEKWGWTDLRGAGVVRVRNGYLLDLPRPEPLD